MLGRSGADTARAGICFPQVAAPVSRVVSFPDVWVLLASTLLRRMEGQICPFICALCPPGTLHEDFKSVTVPEEEEEVPAGPVSGTVALLLNSGFAWDVWLRLV